MTRWEGAVDRRAERGAAQRGTDSITRSSSDGSTKRGMCAPAMRHSVPMAQSTLAQLSVTVFHFFRSNSPIHFGDWSAQWEKVGCAAPSSDTPDTWGRQERQMKARA